MAENFQLRDVFKPAVVTQLAQDIQRAWSAFDGEGFAADINSRLESLSFGDRNGLIRDKLAQYLPQDFPQATQILIDSLGPEPQTDELSGFDGFIIMPQCDFVAKFGLDHFEVSMTALYEMTKRFTAEGAIRPFLQTYPEQTLQYLEKWADDPSPFARRLASEGTRPRLPLAPRLPRFIENPRPVLRLLDKLKTDPVLMVRRSVANNLNDIAKDNPDIVVDTLQAWQAIDTEAMAWLTRHASRTLIKQGHPGALALLGYPPEPEITVRNLTLTTPVVEFGHSLDFHFEIQSQATQPQKLMVDYVIHFMKANGKQAPKVFKLSKKEIGPGETLTLTKTHPLKPISTRKYYAGAHRLRLQINGQVWAEESFELRMEGEKG